MKRVDKRGYVRFTEDPTRSAWEHIRVAENKLGRKLGKTEQVHHINENRTDNSESNLMVLRSNEDHRLIHSKIPYELFKTEDGSFVAIKKQIQCKQCNRLFQQEKYTQIFCSDACYRAFTREPLNQVNKETLKKQVWEMPSAKVAKLYHVSDTTIKKWCRKLGIEKPGRGYWAKVAAKQQ